MTCRFATAADIPTLADANAQLLEDEQHRSRLSRDQLVERWGTWLAGEYRAVLFEEEGEVKPVAYALFRPTDDGVYLRQFFVRRERRRAGVGRAAFELLRRDLWHPATLVRLDVLVQNEAAMRFWRSLGFQDYAVTMELREG